MQNIGKKGMSSVVSSVLLVLMALASVSMIGYALLNFISLSPEQFSCTEAQISPPVKIVSAVFNEETNDLEVVVERSFQSSISVDSLEFTMVSGSQSEKFACTDSCGNCIIVRPGTSEVYYFAVDQGSSVQQVIVGLPGCPLEARAVTR